MTLTLEQVAGWLLQQDAELEGRVTVGAIDANYDRCVGVYNDNRASGGQRICIGGLHSVRLQICDTARPLDDEPLCGGKESHRAV